MIRWMNLLRWILHIRVVFWHVYSYIMMQGKEKNFLQFQVMSFNFSTQSSLRWLRDQIMLFGFLVFHQRKFFVNLTCWYFHLGSRGRYRFLRAMCMQSMIPFQLREQPMIMRHVSENWSVKVSLLYHRPVDFQNLISYCWAWALMAM